MRTSPILLAVLAACSDSSGPRHIPELTTQLSSSVASMSSGLNVTLTASNPTDTTLHLTFTAPPVVAQIKVGGKWQIGTTPFSDGFGPAVDDTLSLTAGAVAPLGTISVVFVQPHAVLPNTEIFSLSPGTYNIRACYYPVPTVSPAGGLSQLQCGNTLVLTLTQ